MQLFAKCWWTGIISSWMKWLFYEIRWPMQSWQERDTVQCIEHDNKLPFINGVIQQIEINTIENRIHDIRVIQIKRINFKFNKALHMITRIYERCGWATGGGRWVAKAFDLFAHSLDICIRCTSCLHEIRPGTINRIAIFLCCMFPSPEMIIVGAVDIGDLEYFFEGHLDCVVLLSGQCLNVMKTVGNFCHRKVSGPGLRQQGGWFRAMTCYRSKQWLLFNFQFNKAIELLLVRCCWHYDRAVRVWVTISPKDLNHLSTSRSFFPDSGVMDSSLHVVKWRGVLLVHVLAADCLLSDLSVTI